MADYIRFDWAMKRLLRDKANHEVLEGFLESLLGEKYTIVRFLESEGNRQSEDDKFNRVDLLAEDSKGEMFLFEVQNGRELQYFHRMMYGTSKLITDYIHIGDDYSRIKKIYSINIIYFELGQGRDYVYHGRTEFRGLHDGGDILRLTRRQNELYFGVSDAGRDAGDLFPEYYILRVNDFNEVARTPIGEWMQFLKTSTIESDAAAPGLARARESLRIDAMSDDEKRAYEAHLDALIYQKNTLETAKDEGLVEGEVIGRQKGLKEGEALGLKKGREEGEAIGLKNGETIGAEKARRRTAAAMKAEGLPVLVISRVTGLSVTEISAL